MQKHDGGMLKYRTEPVSINHSAPADFYFFFNPIMCFSGRFVSVKTVSLSLILSQQLPAASEKQCESADVMLCLWSWEKPILKYKSHIFSNQLQCSHLSLLCFQLLILRYKLIWIITFVLCVLLRACCSRMLAVFLQRSVAASTCSTELPDNRL